MQELSMLQKKLLSMKDKKFCDFQLALCPTVPKETMIGIKTAALKAIAKEMLAGGAAYDFMSQLPHRYFEENQIHAFILCELKDYSEALKEVEKFLPYVDNWATCDQLLPKAFKNRQELLIHEIYRWMDSPHTYTVRFGVGMLMKHYLDDSFKCEYLQRASKIQSEEYYINMMCAWYFATALAKRYEETLPYFEKRMLPVWVHNKAITKARESYRVTEEHKAYLKTLKY